MLGESFRADPHLIGVSDKKRNAKKMATGVDNPVSPGYNGSVVADSGHADVKEKVDMATTVVTPTVPKAVKLAEVDVNAEEGYVQWTFANGFVNRVTPDMFPEHIVRELTLHGISQKLRDPYAGAGKVDNAVEVAVQLHLKVFENLKAGLFRVKAEADGEEPIEQLVQALHEVVARNRPDVTLEQVRAKLVAPEGADEETKGKFTQARKTARAIREVADVLRSYRKNAPTVEAFGF